MKANKLILAALAALLLVSCDDDSNDDKIRINGFANENATVMVDITDGTYQLYWESPIFFTNRNDAIGSPIVKYDVFVKQAGAFLAETKIATVEGSWLNIAADKVSDALNGAHDFKFVVRMADASLSDIVVYNSETLNIDNAGNTSGDYLIAVTAVGEGEVTGGGWYDYGAPLVLTATPNSSDYRFVGWYDDETGSFYSIDNPLKINVTDNMSLIAKFSGGTYMTPLQFENTDFYFNKWFTDGALSSPLKTVEKVDGDNHFLAYTIEVSEAGDAWDNELCCILRGNDGQAENNRFTFDCDVYWESTSGLDSAEIFLLTGKSLIHGNDIDESNDLLLHDDWQWSEENTELITDAGGFLGYVHLLPRKISNKEWTHVSWGDELKIGKKGEEYIGIEIYLNAFGNSSTNLGTFYFRNIEIRMGNYNYIFDY